MRCVRIRWEPGEPWKKKTPRRALWGPGRDGGLAFGNLGGSNAVFDEYSRAGKVGVKSGQEQ